MRKVAYKGLYLFLCSILGMILLAMLHRAIFVLYDLLLAMDYDTYSLGITAHSLAVIDFLSMVVAWFLGGWYGIVLGLDWYAIVYGPNANKPAGLFHGFVPHHWRKYKTEKPRTAKMAAAEEMETTETHVKVPVIESKSNWTFADLMTPTPEPKKRTVRKSTPKPATKAVAKKTVRRVAITKRTKIIAE